MHKSIKNLKYGIYTYQTNEQSQILWPRTLNLLLLKIPIGKGIQNIMSAKCSHPKPPLTDSTAYKHYIIRIHTTIIYRKCFSKQQETNITD